MRLLINFFAEFNLHRKCVFAFVVKRNIVNCSREHQHDVEIQFLHCLRVCKTLLLRRNNWRIRLFRQTKGVECEFILN